MRNHIRTVAHEPLVRKGKPTRGHLQRATDPFCNVDQIFVETLGKSHCLGKTGRGGDDRVAQRETRLHNVPVLPALRSVSTIKTTISNRENWKRKVPHMCDVYVNVRVVEEWRLILTMGDFVFVCFLLVTFMCVDIGIGVFMFGIGMVILLLVGWLLLFLIARFEKVMNE